MRTISPEGSVCGPSGKKLSQIITTSYILTRLSPPERAKCKYSFLRYVVQGSCRRFARLPSLLQVRSYLSAVTITLLTNGNTTEVNALREYIQQMWQQVLGITVELNTVGDTSLFEAEREAGNFDAYYNGWYSDYNDPLDYLNCFYTGEFESVSGSYSNAEFDGYIDALEGETDMDTRLDLYSKAEQLLMDDCAVVPIYYAEKEYFLQNWVKDFCWSSFGASQEFYRAHIEGRGN